MPLYSEELQEQLTRIDSLQQQIDALRPLPADVQARIFQKFRLDWNYHSNSIEGNSLTYGETVAFIMEGVTAKGKPLKDHLDLRGHNQAIEVLLELIKQPEAELTERDIRELHSIIMAEPYEVTVETSAGPQRRTIAPGHYKTMPNHTLTSTGETHYYATPEETPARMHDLIEWYRSHRATLHPLVLAALFHHKFVAIHPFDDGNGRMTRLLTNMLLMKAGYPPIVVKTDEKREYYAVLSQADAGVTEPLLEYFAERLIRSLDIYLKGARGEDISDADDIDKRIALFKASFATDKIIIKADKEIIDSMIKDSISLLLNKIQHKLNSFNSLFLENSNKINIQGNEFGIPRHIAIEFQDIYNWIQKDNNQAYQISKIEYYHSWTGFRNIRNSFSTYYVVNVIFTEYKYTIVIGEPTPFDEAEKIEKPYHEKLSHLEIDNIIEKCVTGVMQRIEQGANI